MVRNPNGGTAQGTKRVYFAYANLVECGVISCTVREVVRTRTVVEFKYFPTYYGYSVGGQPGVLTAYCDNYNPECPSWVSASLKHRSIWWPVRHLIEHIL